MFTGDLYACDLSDPKGPTPTLVEALRGEHILEMSGAFAKTLILTGKGAARRVAPGSTEAAPVEELAGLDGMLAQVAFGSKHMAALTHSGQVYTLGAGSEGQLGHGSTANSMQPQLVGGLASRAVAQVACGKSHSVALTAEGDVYTWGGGDAGQLGSGRTGPSFVPRYVSALQGTPVAMIATGASHCAALSVYGRVYTWGEALCGQLGHGKPLHAQKLPVEVADLPDCQAVACGDCHTVALTAEHGDVYAWGLATRGPPTSRKATASPERLDGLDERIESVVCGGGSTLLTTASGGVLCWPGSGREVCRVALPPGVRVTRMVCGGEAALLFVETSITRIAPVCAPLAGGTTLTLHGAGFYASSGIVLRLTHASGEQKLVRGTLEVIEGAAAERVVRAEAPDFSASGDGAVEVCVSFEEGEGDTFSSTPVTVRAYTPPRLAELMPSCAPAGEPTPISVSVAGADALFDAPDATAFLYAADGTTLLATAPAAVDGRTTLRVTTPAMGAPCAEAVLKLALDGQTPTAGGLPLCLHAPIEFTALTPRCGAATGGALLTVKGTNLFASRHVSARFTVLPPPPPPPPPTPPPAPPPAAEGEAEGDGDGAPPPEGDADGDGAADVSEAAAAPAAEEEPPAPRLPEGKTFEVTGEYDARAAGLVFAMPACSGVGDLAVELTVDSIHYLPAPAQFTIHAPVSVGGLSPPVGSVRGGAKLQIAGKGLFGSPETCVLFVKGATRLVVPAAFDEASGCIVCDVPAWPPAVEAIRAHEAAVAAANAANEAAAAKAAEAAAEEGAEAAEPELVEVPGPLELAPELSDCIVEVSLNGQQWTTDCKHFAFVLDATVTGAEPAAGPLEGGAELKILAEGVAEGAVGVKARFTRLPPLEEGAEAHTTLPAEGDDGAVAMVVDATACEGGVEVTAPAFEVDEGGDGFDVAVQLALDGYVYGPSFAVYTYEGAAAAKGGKKK